MVNTEVLLPAGTIGNFLASVIAGSGLNASGPVGGPSGLFTSGLVISGPSRFDAGRRLGYISISASGNIVPASTNLFIVDTTAASMNIGLPSAATASLGYIWILKKSSDTNSLIVSAATGDDIEGAGALSNTAAYAKTLLWTPGSISWLRLLPSAGVL